MQNKIIMSWSGGKDSALALYHLQKQNKYKIAALLTACSEKYNRISMHGVSLNLLELQVQAIGLPLYKVFIPESAGMESYDFTMRNVLLDLQKQNIIGVAFGDIFLEDLKQYREDKLAQINMQAVFPLWGNDSAKLAQEFIDSGFESIITCVSAKMLHKKYCGRKFNKRFLDDLPENIDHCGENGEFHSFVYNAPFFKNKILCQAGDNIKINGFYYCNVGL